MRKYVLIAIFALIAYVSYQPVKAAFLGVHGARYLDGVLTCTYKGQAFHEQEQRRADDACNVCTCGADGWACTRMACLVGGAGTGTITGTLSAPQGDDIPAQRVCAANLKDEDKEFCQQTTEGMREYAINVSPGDYWVYAARVADKSGKRAYWSEYVKCGSSYGCRDHAPITVAVTAGQIAKADPHDWMADAQIDLLNVTPSKWVYSTHNYYPNSVFLAKGRGLASITIMATSYPPQDGAAPFSLGAMRLESQDLGIQTWTLPVPQGGFQAGTVYAVGTNAQGETTRSRALRIVRPIETAE